MILLPILASFLGTIKSKVRPREKWSTCLMASHQIVCQIYYFRLRTANYDVLAPPADPEAPPIPMKTRHRLARMDFVKTTGEIYDTAISSEVSKGGALKVKGTGKMQHQRESERAVFKELLLAHIRYKLHVNPNFYEQLSTRKRKKPQDKKKKKNKVAPAAPAAPAAGAPAMENDEGEVEGGGEAMATAAAGAVAAVAAAATGGSEAAPVEEEDDDLTPLMDDLVSVMDIESYIECRVRPIVNYLENRAPVMSRRFNVLEGTYLIASTTGAVLSIAGHADWVAVSVAVASTAMALNDYFYVPAQLGATNRALSQCHNLITWWDSLSLVQRKTRAAKTQAATTVEGALLDMCNARTAVSAALPSEAGEEDEEE